MSQVWGNCFRCSNRTIESLRKYNSRTDSKGYIQNYSTLTSTLVLRFKLTTYILRKCCIWYIQWILAIFVSQNPCLKGHSSKSVHFFYLISRSYHSMYIPYWNTGKAQYFDTGRETSSESLSLSEEDIVTEPSKMYSTT